MIMPEEVKFEMKFSPNGNQAIVKPQMSRSSTKGIDLIARPSAKAASADEQINKVLIKALRHLPTTDNCLERNLGFTKKHFNSVYSAYARSTYIFFCVIVLPP
jgi:hypothetical protein